MKRKVITLMALSGMAFGAELVTDLKLDGNFNDAKGNLTFGGSQAGNMQWSTTSPIVGSNGYVTVGNNKAMWNGDFDTPPSNTNFAITLFVNPSAYPVFDKGTNNNAVESWAAQWIIGGGTTGGNGIKLGIGCDGQLKLDVKNCFSTSSGSNNVITLNKWSQVGLSVIKNTNGTSGYEYTLFIDGVSVASVNQDYTSNWMDGAFALFEGADFSKDGTRFSGLVDEIQFYNVSDYNDAVTVMRTQAARLVPEPTTATLSLLALVGLAARRRRK